MSQLRRDATLAEHPWQMSAGGAQLRVRVTPKSARDAVEGMEQTADGPAIKIRVRAVPADGEANAAAERLIAKWLGVPRSAVRLVAGGKSRVKTIAITGNPGDLEEKMWALVTG